MTVLEKLNKRIDMVNSLACAGLDSDFDKIPERFKTLEFPQFEFNKFIIEQTREHVCAFKPNSAFYEARGEQGMRELKMTVDYINKNYPDIVAILDAKRADIGSTNKGYVAAIFDWLGFDAVTLHPYLGKEALAPFLERHDKACVILCRTSNPGAGEIQDLEISGKPLWLILAEKVKKDWNENNNCMLVVGATYPEEMNVIRKAVGDMTFLVPGVGAQGGSVEEIIKAGINSERKGLIINSSRQIIFSDDPRKEAIKLKEEINKYR